jgi:2'-5' RNA ligase
MIATATVLSSELFNDIVLPSTSRLPPFHLTWHVAATYDWHGASEVLETITETTIPFDVEIEGAHVFVTDRFAVVGLVRQSEALEKLHDRIVVAMSKHAHHLDLRYATGQWVPHVTLASGLSEEEARDVGEDFERREAGKSLAIDNLAFLSVESGRFILSNVRRFSRGRLARPRADA